MELRFTKTKKHGSLPKSEKLIYYGKKNYGNIPSNGRF